MLSCVPENLPLLFAQSATLSFRVSPFSVLFVLLLVLAVGFAVFAVWNQQLRQRVAERTRELEEKADALEHEARERRVLEKRQKQLLKTVEASSDYIGIADANGYTLYLNRAGRRMVEVGDDEELGKKHIADYHPKSEHERMMTEILPALHTDGRWLGEINIASRTGREIPVSQLILAHRDKTGSIQYFSTVGRDMTQRKQADLAFQEIQRTLLTLMSNLPGMAYRCRNDRDWTMEFVSGGAKDLTGYEAYELIDNRVVSYNELVVDEHQEMLWNTVQEAIKEKKSFRINYRIRTRFSSERWVWEQGRGVYASDGSLEALEGFITDVTERRIAEDALRDSEERFRFLADNLPGVIYLCRNDERYTAVYLNDAIEDLLGYDKSEFLTDRLSIVELYHPEDLPKVTEIVNNAVAGREPYHAIYRLQHRSGEWRWIEEFGTGVFRGDELIFLEGFLRDITERRHMEEVLAQSDKMLVVGGLAAGMAHEINNPIMAICNAQQNIQRRLTRDLPANQQVAGEVGLDLAAMESYLRSRKIHEFLDEIRDGAQRTTQIVQDLLHFSRTGNSKRSLTDLDRTAQRATRLLATEWSANPVGLMNRIKISIETVPDLPQVLCDDNKIEQVLLNLIRNAAQAFASNPDHPAPRIAVSLSTEKGWVRIEVRDNGPGIDAATRKRIFEPFFTTKEVGEGTGLGLSVSYFLIVDQHNGTLEVESEAGEGACFILRLPVPPG